MNKISKYMILAAVATQLVACQATTGEAPTTESRIDSARARAEDASGITNTSVANAERQYKKNSNDPAAALEYATALRKTNYQSRAQLVLAPFAKQGNAHAGVKAEMAAIELSLGNYDNAEDYAQQAILQNPEDFHAYQTLGIALDAKKMHPEAERAFRKGLEKWQGDPTPIMNNLALNLATQGFVDEAVEILLKAKELAPDRIELERNLRIVRTMNER